MTAAQALSVAATLATVAIAAACAQAASSTPAPPPPDPAVRRAEMEAAALRADDVRRSVLAGSNPSGLASAFAGAALAAERARALELARRGTRVEETSVRRRLVHWSDAGGLQVVIEISVQQRLLSGGQPATWAASLRQWSVDLRREGGALLVTRAADLPPPAWWP